MSSLSKMLKRLLFLLLFITTFIVPDFLLNRPPISWIISAIGRLFGLDHYLSSGLMGIMELFDSKQEYSKQSREKESITKSSDGEVNNNVNLPTDKNTG